MEKADLILAQITEIKTLFKEHIAAGHACIFTGREGHNPGLITPPDPPVKNSNSKGHLLDIAISGKREFFWAMILITGTLLLGVNVILKLFGPFKP